MANNIKIVVEGENRTGKAFNDVRASMDKLGGSAGNLRTKALDPLNKALGTGLKIAGGIAVGAIAGLTVAVAGGVKAAMDMEQQIADIASVMNLAADQTAPLKSLIQSLGIDPKLKVSATEAADAIEMLGRNGLTMTEIMDGAARGTILLANATNADFGDAADIATDAMALFNIEARDMAKAVNGIASVTVNSKFSINDYKLALAQAGGVASVVGVEFDDFNATIAAISPYFASGSDAGTSFKVMLQRLIPASSEAEQIMAELGLITTDYGKAASALAKGLGREVEPSLSGVSMAFDELTKQTGQTNMKYSEFIAGFKDNQFFDQKTGKMRDMKDIIGLLNTAFGGLTEEQKNNALSTIFGTDAMRAAAAMAGYTEDQFIEFKNTLSKTDAEQMAATRMNTLSGVMEILRGVVDTLRMQIGDAFLPVLRRLAELFTEQAQIHGPRLVIAFQSLAAQLTVALDRLMPWISQALPKMIEQIPAVVTGLINFARQAFEVGTAIYSVVAPVVRFVAGLTDLKGVLIIVGSLMAISAVAQVITFVASVVSAVTAVTGFIGALGLTMPALTAVLVAIGPVVAIVAAVTAAVVALYLAWKNNWFGIRDITGQAVEYIRNLITNLPASIEGIKNTLYTWASGAMSRMREGFLAGRDWVRGAIDNVLDYVRGANFGGMAQSMFDQARHVVNRIGEGFRNQMNWARDQLQQVLTDVQNGGVGYAAGAMAGRMYEAARGVVVRFGQGINEAAPHLRGDMQRALQAVIDITNGWSGGAAGHLYAKAREVMGRLSEGFRGFDLAGGVRSALDGAVNVVNGWAGGAGGHLYQKAREVMTRLSEGFRGFDLAGGVRPALDGAVNVVNGWAGGAGGHLYQKAREVMTRLSEGFRGFDLGGGIRSALDGLTNTVNGWSNSTQGHLYNKAREVMTRLSQGFQGFDLGGGIRGSLDGITTAVNNWSNSAQQHLYIKASEIGRRLMEGLRDGIQGMFGAVISKMNEVTNLLPQWLRDRLGIRSPSRVFMEIGGHIMEGLAEGIQNAMDLPENAMAATANNLTQTTNMDRSDRRTWNFSINQAGNQDGNPAADVRMLSMLYSGT